MSAVKRKREDEGDDDAATRARKMAAMLSQGIGIATPAPGTGSAPAPGQSGIGGGGTARTVKIRVPTELNPGFNYMGLLLGPRGETLKRMESESGARLKIRGRETLRAGQQPKGPEDEEPLHVTITASSDQQADIATRLVNELLFDDKKAMAIKQAQLEEIALVKSGGAAAPGAALRTGLEHQQGIPPANGAAAAAAGGAYGAPGGAANSFAEGDNTIVMIPTNFAGIIIGRGGENIRAIQQDTGARIQVQRTEEVRPGDKRRITISGEASARTMAKSIVEKMVADRELEDAQGGGARTRGSGGNGSGITVTIPHEHVGLIIGRGGGTIKGIQARTGTNVQIPQDPDLGSNPPVRTATITGSPEGVAAAKMEILHLISGSLNTDGSSSLGGGGGPGTTMQVPDDKVGSIIGRQGASINAIQQRTGCRVQIPRECDPGSMPPTRTVQLTGRPEACAAAIREIEGILNYGAGAGGSGFLGHLQPQQQYGAGGGYQQQQQQQQPYGYQQQQYHQQQQYGYQQQQMGGYGAPGGYQQQQQAPQQGGAPPPPPAGAPMAQTQQHAAAPAGAAHAAASAGAGGAVAAAGGAAKPPTPAEIEAHRKAWEEYYRSQGYAMPKQ